MKLKLIINTKQLLILLFTFCFINSNEIKSLERKYAQDTFYRTSNSENDYIIPQVKSPDFLSLGNGGVIPRISSIHQTHHIPCPCAATFRCRPCGVIATPEIDLYPEIVECPCAHAACPVCPPLSLLHEIASKKAVQDQQLAFNLKNISTKMSKFFDLVIKYAGDVVNYEKDAKDAARKMEEASLKAQFSRKSMFTVIIY
jgi:hypothetical protein